MKKSERSGNHRQKSQAQRGAAKGLTFQELLLTLEEYWASRDCVLQQPYDVEVGAGTMHPETFLRVLGPIPIEWSTRSLVAGQRMDGTGKIRIGFSSIRSFK